MADTSLRFFLDALGQTLPVSPTSEGTATLTKEGNIDAFYLTEKASGPLVFSGEDFRILYGIEQSTSRCEKLGLRLLQGNTLLAQTAFTTSQCTFDLNKCTASVTPGADDGYALLTAEWGREYNILAAPAFATPTLLTSNLRSLLGNVQIPGRGGISVEFKRINSTAETDYLGNDGWGAFLRDTSHIGPGGLRQVYTIIFRYLQLGVPQVFDTETNSYAPVDKSNSGWVIIDGNDTATPPTVDYARAPDIAGFKPYNITNYGNWYYPFDPAELPARPIYGNELLALPCGTTPSQYGFNTADYIEVTGPGGVNNAPECPTCLNLRRRVNRDNCRSIWWRFGVFRFRHCAPLLPVLHYLLRKTVPSLCPPTPAELSAFFSATTNPATGDTGAANELTRLYVAAGSDIKRPNASEPATRLPISLKQVLDDLKALYKVGHYIDPATGFLRLEHRASQLTAGPILDARQIDGATLPAVYSYQEQQMPKYQQLTVSNALTEDPITGVSFKFAELAYAGNCVNQREGENTQTTTVSRLTGDLAGLLLSGESLPDTCIALLAAAPDGATIAQANQAVAASTLVSRYHLHDGILPTATLSTGDGTPETPVAMLAVRPPRVQDSVTLPCVDWLQISKKTKVATTLTDAGRITKAVLNLRTGRVTLTLALPPVAGDQEPPITEARQFDNSFSNQFA